MRDRWTCVLAQMTWEPRLWWVNPRPENATLHPSPKKRSRKKTTMSAPTVGADGSVFFFRPF